MDKPKNGKPSQEPNGFTLSDRVKATKRKLNAPQGRSRVTSTVRKLPYSIGTTVSKVFRDPKTGKDRPFSGEISVYDPRNKLYEIIYEDGDVEVVKEAEVSKMIKTTKRLKK